MYLPTAISMTPLKINGTNYRCTRYRTFRPTSAKADHSKTKQSVYAGHILSGSPGHYANIDHQANRTHAAAAKPAGMSS